MHKKIKHLFLSLSILILAMPVAYAADIETGPIGNNEEARDKCPVVCTEQGMQWSGSWQPVEPDRAKCSCDTTTPQAVPQNGKQPLETKPSSPPVLPSQEKLLAPLQEEVDAAFKFLGLDPTITYDQLKQQRDALEQKFCPVYRTKNPPKAIVKKCQDFQDAYQTLEEYFTRKPAG